ncbi:hypothetical protein [Streptomyces sp. URMC 123]|uniref:hypothetical protein n=1 Tax=Streptomyces sp. URMC 123 TaxID=3423403 RepID=UPI003F19CEE8
MRQRTVHTLWGTAALALGSLAALLTTTGTAAAATTPAATTPTAATAAPAAAGQDREGPAPFEYATDGKEIKLCTRGTLFHGLANLGCRPPHHLDRDTTWRELREQESAVAPMLCGPSVMNRTVDSTEVALLGAGAALQCSPVPATWRP